MSDLVAAFQSVLFVCGRNSIRSPMAAALARQLFPNSLYVESAGVTHGEPDPFAQAALAEIGLTLEGHRPRAIDDLVDTNFDLVITLSPEAHHRALELTRTRAMDVEYWPTLDPTHARGSRQQIMDAYRNVRDSLAERLRLRFSQGGEK